MGELKEGLDSARKEVEKAADTAKQSSGITEMNESLKETFREAAPAGDEIKSGLDEIDQAAKEFSDEISRQSSKDEPAATGETANEGQGEPSRSTQ